MGEKRVDGRRERMEGRRQEVRRQKSEGSRQKTDRESAVREEITTKAHEESR